MLIRVLIRVAGMPFILNASSSGGYFISFGLDFFISFGLDFLAVIYDAFSAAGTVPFFFWETVTKVRT